MHEIKFDRTNHTWKIPLSIEISLALIQQVNQKIF